MWTVTAMIMSSAASRKLSRALAPSAHRTIQRQSEAVMEYASPMSRRILALQRRGERADELPDGGRRIGRLRRRADQAAAHDHAVGAGLGGLHRLLGRADAEAQCDGHVGVRLGARD